MQTSLSINQQSYTLDVDPEMPLLWALRDNLRLTGTKYGCGLGICSACMVLVDGEIERACLLKVGECANKEIFTIEGFPKDGSHPIQKAWQDLNVPQCGYCQSGQMIATKALLDKNPQPSVEEIQMALAENVCRCGTYPRIVKAIRSIGEGN